MTLERFGQATTLKRVAAGASAFSSHEKLSVCDSSDKLIIVAKSIDYVIFLKLTTRGFVATLGLHQIVCWGTLTYGVTVFAPAMATRAGVPVAAIMAAYSAGLLFNAAVAPACTRWVMRGNALRGGVVGLATGVLACLVLAFAWHVSLVFAGFALAGAAMALTQYDFAWLCVRLFHPHNARRVVTGVTLFGALASSIMWPIAHQLNVRFGLVTGWLGLATIMALVGGGCLWLFTRAAVPNDSPAGEEASVAPPAQSHPPLDATSTRYVVLGLTLVSSVGAGLAANLPLLLSKFQASPGAIAGVLSLFGIGQLLARGLDFLSSKRTGLGVTLQAAVAACAVFWLLLVGLAWAGESFLMLALAVLLMGASNGLLTILRGATPQLLFWGEQFTHVSAQLASAGSVARAILPLAVALALESAMPIWAVAVLCSATLFVGAWWVWQHARHALR